MWLPSLAAAARPRRLRELIRVLVDSAPHTQITANCRPAHNPPHNKRTSENCFNAVKVIFLHFRPSDYYIILLKDAYIFDQINHESMFRLFTVDFKHFHKYSRSVLEGSTFIFSFLFYLLRNQIFFILLLGHESRITNH